MQPNNQPPVPDPTPAVAPLDRTILDPSPQPLAPNGANGTPLPPVQPNGGGRGKRIFAFVCLAAVIILAVVVLAIVVNQAKKTPSTKSAVTTNNHAQSSVEPLAINITKDAFVPSTAVIKVGQGVVWTNTDSAAHSITANTSVKLPNFDSGQSLSTSDTYSYVFDKAGTYSYQDGTNPYGFTGTVVVK